MISIEGEGSALSVLFIGCWPATKQNVTECSDKGISIDKEADNLISPMINLGLLADDSTILCFHFILQCKVVIFIQYPTQHWNQQ